MKKLIFIVFALLITQVSFGQDTLKIMTYNLRFGELASMESIGRYISLHKPDIVALQECDWNTKRKRAVLQNGVKFINVLASTTGMFGVYGKAIDYAGGYYGIGILSKYPIIKSKRVFLPNPTNNEQRVVLVTEVELDNGRVLKFACTHLDYELESNRLTQVKFIDNLLKKDELVFLAGDMNAEKNDGSMQYLNKNWKDLTNNELTFSTYKPENKIDYIYVKSKAKVELLSTEVLTDSKLSDHFPVISTVIIK